MTNPADPNAPAPELVEAGFALEVADAPLLHAGLNLADLAHLCVLSEQGIVPADAARGLARLLLEVHEQSAEAFPYDPAYGEVYNCRERYFRERVGRDAGWLHAGRPRREAVRIALRLRLREEVAALCGAAAGFALAGADRAAEHVETFMADQTYLQQAHPSTFGHYLLAFVHPALRDLERLEGGLAWTNRSPGGSGCVNGSRLLTDRGRIAELLGFDAVIEHTRDAMWQIDGLLDLLAAAASLGVTLTKLAEDLEIWASREFDFVDLAGPYTRASVLMPQKRNPYALSIVRGDAGRLIGDLTGMFAIMKSPSARSDNLIFAYGAVPRALETARKAADLMRGVVATLTVNGHRMMAALLSGFSQATDLAEYIMQRCGLDYRTAYLVVGAAVRRTDAAGGRGVDLTGEALDDAAREVAGEPLGLAGADLRQVLDPERIVRSRELHGGAAPDVVRAMADDCRARAEQAGEAARARTRAFADAENRLLAAARNLADG